MVTKFISHAEIQNGMRVWIQGNLFTVSDFRMYEDLTGPHPGIPVVRFTGTVEGEDYGRIKNTGYDGGTYGARWDYPATVEL